MNNAFYFIDKPLDITSFDIIRILRKRFDIKKMGHTGTLDPLASGGLFLATGNYTKLIPYFEKDLKEYEFTISLNGISESMDLGTPVTYISLEKQDEYKKNISRQHIQEIIDNNFTGEINQIPPKYSALKINGKTALMRAKSGEEFEMKSRIATITQIEILEYNYPEIMIKATVTAGTYIRSIASDMGEIIGSGGHITKLRRTKIGCYDIKDAIPLDDLLITDRFPVERLFSADRYLTFEADILMKINNGLEIKGAFDIPINQDMFIADDQGITNIIMYDGVYLRPQKRI